MAAGDVRMLISGGSPGCNFICLAADKLTKPATIDNKGKQIAEYCIFCNISRGVGNDFVAVCKQALVNKSVTKQNHRFQPVVSFKYQINQNRQRAV